VLHVKMIKPYTYFILLSLEHIEFSRLLSHFYKRNTGGKEAILNRNMKIHTDDINAEGSVQINQ